jgi:isopentenyldiphosphate isomerase
VVDLIDVLDNAGLRTGEILPRADIHRLGKVHRAAHLYLLNGNNELLLQRRSLTVDQFADVYSISVTGHVKAGEYSSACIRREVEEELGIHPSQMCFDFIFSFYQEAILSETYIDRQFNDFYLARLDIDPACIQFDRSEVSEVKFIPLKHFQEVLLSQPFEISRYYENECREITYFLHDLIASS